jgi:hypothetical protein
MDNKQSSEIISNKKIQNEIAQNESSATVLQTQPVSIIDPESNNSFALKKLVIFCAAGVLALSVFFIFAKGTDVCLAINCNDYSDSVATGSSSSTSIGTDFVAYAIGSATLIVLTALVGVPLISAVAISTGVWFVVQMIH